MSLCTPTAHEIVEIHITSGMICAKPFRCLEVCMAGRSTLALCKHANINVIVESHQKVPVDQVLPSRNALASVKQLSGIVVIPATVLNYCFRSRIVCRCLNC